MGNEEGFPHIFFTFSNELPQALLLAPKKEIFGRSSNRQNTRCLFLWKQVEDWRKTGQGAKKINSFQGKLQSLCSCWMFYGKFLCSWDTSWKSVVCYKCSIRAVFHSAFCFAPIVLMKDTNGKCVSHVYGLLWSPQQWRPMRHHHSPSTSIISGWCWCPYWWHLITQEEVQASLT